MGDIWGTNQPKLEVNERNLPKITKLEDIGGHFYCYVMLSEVKGTIFITYWCTESAWCMWWKIYSSRLRHLPCFFMDCYIIVLLQQVLATRSDGYQVDVSNPSSIIPIWCGIFFCARICKKRILFFFNYYFGATIGRFEILRNYPIYSFLWKFSGGTSFSSSGEKNSGLPLYRKI